MRHFKTLLTVSFAATIAALCFVPGPVAASEDIVSRCEGDPGFRLCLPDDVAIGTTFGIGLEAPAGWLVALFVSGGEGPTMTPFGELCLDFPPLAVFTVVMPPAGQLCLSHYMHCDESLVGAVGFMQFIAIDTTTGESGISNQDWIQVEEGDCAGRDDDDSSDDNSDEYGDDGSSDSDDDSSSDDESSDDVDDDASCDCF